MSSYRQYQITTYCDGAVDRSRYPDFSDMVRLPGVFNALVERSNDCVRIDGLEPVPDTKHPSIVAHWSNDWDDVYIADAQSDWPDMLYEYETDQPSDCVLMIVSRMED